MRQQVPRSPTRRGMARASVVALERRALVIEMCWRILFWIVPLLLLTVRPGWSQETSEDPAAPAQEVQVAQEAPAAEEISAETLVEGPAEPPIVERMEFPEYGTAIEPGALLSLSDRFSLTVEERPLGEVLAVLAQHYRVNFIVGQGLRNRTVSLYLHEVGLDDSINGLLEAVDLTYKRIPESNLFIIKERGAEPANLMTKAIRLQYLDLEAAGPDRGEPASLLASWNGELPSDRDPTALDARITSTARLVAVVENVLSEHGSVVAEVASNSLVVTDLPERVAEAEQMIARLDVAVIVLIDVEIVGSDSGALARMDAILGAMDGEFGRSLELTAEGPPAGQLFTAESETFDIMMQALQAEATSRLRSQRRKLLTLNSQATTTAVTTEPAVAVERSLDVAGELSTLMGGGESEFELEMTPEVNGDGSIAVDLQVVSRRGDARMQASVTIDPGHTLLVSGFLPSAEASVADGLTLASVPEPQQAAGQRELMILVTPQVVPSSWMRAN